MHPASVNIDGFGPLPLARPATVAELGDLVRGASAERPIYPCGGQTQLGLGRTPTVPGTAVDLRGLDRVVDFPARDMTITVEAGITIAKLQTLIAAENLRLPIDVPNSDRATLGGILATNVSGSRRFGYGTLRDYVIGISAINDDGNEFKAGGRVVKNVAGYDLCKLLVGSLGTIGVISQVTLKLRPLAEEQAILRLPCEAGKLGALLDRLAISRTRPVILDVVNRDGAKRLTINDATPSAATERFVLVGYEGNADAVKWQVQQLVKELGGSFAVEACVGYTSKPLDLAMSEWPASPDAKLTLKASLLPSATADFISHVESLGSVPALRAHAGNGIVLGHYAGEVSLASARDLVAGWRKGAAAVVVVRCPTDWKPELNVWGPPPTDIDAMREVKKRFDPRGVFNPGRFVV